MTDVKKRLEEIAAAIAAGADPKKFDKEMDQLLGTELPERDAEAEERWENSYRRGGSDEQPN
jgi:hypothetical protein